MLRQLVLAASCRLLGYVATMNADVMCFSHAPPATGQCTIIAEYLKYTEIRFKTKTIQKAPHTSDASFFFFCPVCNQKPS